MSETQKEKAAAMHEATDIGTLIERVEEIGEFDRSLDADLDVALFGGETVWRQQNYTMDQHPATKRSSKMHVGGFAYEHVPLYTGSIDAVVSAVARLLPDHDTEVFRDREANLVTVSIVKPLGDSVSSGFVGQHESEPIATILALLRSLKAKEERNG